MDKTEIDQRLAPRSDGRRSLVRLLVGLTLVTQTLVALPTPVAAEQIILGWVTFTPSTVAVGDSLSVTAFFDPFDVGCGVPATVDLVDVAPPYGLVAHLGSIIFGCTNSVTHSFIVPSVPPGADLYRVRVALVTGQIDVSPQTLTVIHHHQRTHAEYVRSSTNSGFHARAADDPVTHTLYTVGMVDTRTDSAPRLLSINTQSSAVSTTAPLSRAPVVLAFDPVARGAAVFRGHIALPSRPASPDASWQIPLHVSFLHPGTNTVVLTASPTTDKSDGFSVPGVAPGTYDVKVKFASALSKLAPSMRLVSGDNPVLDFGMLAAGDVNNDDVVDLLDFSSLRVTFGQCAGDAGYDARADLNGDGWVDLLDLSLLRANFGRVGPQPVP